MDRNSIPMKSLFVLIQSLSARRAWIEISFGLYSPLLSRLSLSARRAWIEINRFQGFGGSTNVALRKESVDRNSANLNHLFAPMRSLSARRAWIEIGFERVLYCLQTVALRKESVDRNLNFSKNKKGRKCRSPQGERG